MVKENLSHHQLDNRFVSPAKINLFFRVLSKRPDGYHEIATKMQAISLFDELLIDKSDRDSFSCSDSSLPLDETNLVCKAVALFRSMTRERSSFSIHLQKNIPTQAGLGGGSSNAATTLFALNSLSGSPLTTAELQAASAQLGADVPFFFSSGTAYCTGIGEKVENLPFQSGECQIIKPKWGVSTHGVYTHARPDGCSCELPLQLLLKEELVNDLELPVFSMYPKLETLKKRLIEEGFSPLVLTGSGSSFVCYGTKTGMLGEEIEVFRAKHIQRKSDTWYSSL